MDVDSALKRYLAKPDVANWLFSTEDIRTVTTDALDAAFTYAIGFGPHAAATPRAMDIEDMLIVCGVSGHFLLGVVWGLSQPHVFSLTPLMLGKKPLSRRFAVDLSARHALEFMEFDAFEDGKLIVMFRQFLHTRDHALPVVACARLHAGSQLQHSLGHVLMRADLFEAASCPACGGVGKSCHCTFDSYAPSAAVARSTFNWTQFADMFMHKTREGILKLRMTASLPDVGELEIMDSELPLVNILQKGDTEYMNLLRRKAVHGLGINVVLPRADTSFLVSAVENDFVDLHNHYVSRKRVREPVDQAAPLVDTNSLDLTGAYSLLQATTGTSDSLQSVDDMLSVFPGIFSAGNSPGIFAEDGTAKPEHDIADLAAAMSQPSGGLNNTVSKPRDSSEGFVMNPAVFLGGGDTISTSRKPDTQQSNTDLLNEVEHLFSSPISHQTVPSPESGPAEPPLQYLQQTSTPKAPLPLSSVSSEDSSVNHSGASAQPVTKQPKKPSAKRTKRRVQPAGDNIPEEDKKHACNTCSSRFKMRGDLLRHVKTVHEGKKMFTCGTCGKAFGHSGHLNRHISSVHLQQRRFKCQYCGFLFFQASHLQSHIGHIHSEKKPFECKECGLRVLSEGALKKHIKSVHSAEQPKQMDFWQCPYTGCGSRHELESQLQFHVLTVHQSLNAANFHGHGTLAFSQTS